MSGSLVGSARVLLLLLIPLLPTMAFAQQDSDSPEVVAGRFLDAVNEKEWPTATVLFDEVALAWWHREAIESIEKLRDNPLAAGVGPIMLRRHGVESIDELRLIPPLEAVERFLAASLSRVGQRALMEEMMGMMGGTVEEGELADDLFASEHSLVGVVRGDEASAYAVFIERIAAAGEGPPQVLVLRRSRDGWRVVPQSLFGGKRDYPPDEFPAPMGPK